MVRKAREWGREAVGKGVTEVMGRLTERGPREEQGPWLHPRASSAARSEAESGLQ